MNFTNIAARAIHPGPETDDGAVEPWLTRVEIADYLRVHPGTVDRMMKRSIKSLQRGHGIPDDGLPFIRIGSKPLFKISTVDDHLRNPPPKG